MFYDITASPDGRSVDRSWVRRVARILDIPFCVAGGIRSVADAEEVLGEGAEKISINSPALADPDLIDRLSARFGAQCVVVGIDSQTDRRRLLRLPIHRRPQPHAQHRASHARLGARSARPRRRRDRAQLHGKRRRAPGLRHRTADIGQADVQRAADRFRRRRAGQSTLPMCSTKRASTARWPPAYSTPARWRFPSSSGICARRRSRSAHEPGTDQRTRLGARTTACCRPSCRTRAAARC